LATEDLLEHLHIDVAPGQDYRHPLSGLLHAFLDECRQRSSTSTFGNIVRVGVDNARRLRDFIVTDADDACRAMSVDFEWLGLRIAARQPIRERSC
jgi:hypothetical protein